MPRFRSLFACALALACGTKETSPASSQQRSPNANVLPAPLTETRERVTRQRVPTLASAGLPIPIASSSSRGERLRAEPDPTPFSPLHAPDADRDSPKLKETQLLVLEAVWRWPSLDAGALEPEADLATIDSTNKLLTPSIKIELHPAGRMRWVWAANVFPLPEGSELRSRLSNYGHVLVWASERKARVIAPGTLRTTLGERRADAIPLVEGTLRHLPNGQRVGHATQVSELATAYGSLHLEQAQLDEIGGAGQLLCRTLVELAGADPASEACLENLLPVRAEFRSVDGGHCVLEVTSLTSKSERSDGVSRFIIPPPNATFQNVGLPEVSAMMIDEGVQRKVHSRDRVVGTGPTTGFTANNSSPHFAYLLLDRVRALRLSPYSAVRLNELRPGRYRATWHGFLGQVLTEPRLIDVPGGSSSVAEPSTADEAASR